MVSPDYPTSTWDMPSASLPKEDRGSCHPLSGWTELYSAIRGKEICTFLMILAVTEHGKNHFHLLLPLPVRALCHQWWRYAELSTGLFTFSPLTLRTLFFFFPQESICFRNDEEISKGTHGLQKNVTSEVLSRGLNPDQSSSKWSLFSWIPRTHCLSSGCFSFAFWIWFFGDRTYIRLSELPLQTTTD